MEFFVLWLLFAIATGIVASRRGGSAGFWGFLGLVFGPFALLAAFTVGKACPACRSKIHKQAPRCPRCQAQVA